MIIEFEDLKLEVLVNYKPKNRHIYFKISDKKIEINTYKHLSENEIKKIISSNYEFIKKKITENKKYDNHQLHLFGKSYDFKIIETVYDEVRIEDGIIVIYTRVNDYSYNKKLIDKFYIEMLKDFSFNHYNEIYSRFSDVVLVKPILNYKVLKTCYGKYDRIKHTITLSSHLAKYDPFYIMLVMAHELCHVIYMNHQKEFYVLFESKFPSAKKNQHSLRKIKYNDYF